MAEMQAAASYVEVLPSLRGFFSRIKKSVTGRSVDVGVTPKVSKADLLKAEAAVKEAADGVVKARTKEADAAGTLRTAEAKLQDLRDTGNAKAAQLVAAEERVAKARRASEAATASLNNAEGRERTATRKAERITVELESDTGEATAELEGWHARMKAAIGELRTYVDIDTGMATAKLLALSKIQVGTFGIAAAVDAILSLGPALAPATGALALLPAIAGAGAVGVTLIKTAFKGFGDAIGDDPKKAAEALAEMAPAARDTAGAVNSLKPAWAGLQLDVQQRLFDGLGARVRDTGGTYLPILRGALSGLAGDLNGPIRDAFDVLDERDNITGIATALGFVRGGLAEAGGALAPLTQAFTTLFVYGAPYVTRFGAGIRDAAGGFSLFIGQSSRAGLITVWIDNALVVLAQLGALVGNVFSIVGSLMSAAASSGGNLLAVLVSATGAAAAFLNSAQGIALVEGFFRGVATAVGLASPLFSAIGSALATTIIPALSAGLPVVGRAVGALAPAVAPLAGLFAALVPLVTQLTLALAQYLAGALVAILPFITSLVTSLSQYPGIVAAVVAGFVIFGAILGPVVRVATAVGGLLPILNVLRVAVMGAGGPLAVLGRAFTFLTGPIGIAVGLFTLLMATNAGFRDAIFGLLGAVGNLVGTLVSALLPVFSAVLAAVLPLVDVLAAVLVPVVNVVAGLINFLAPILGFLAPIILGVVAAIRAWAIVQAVINALMMMNPVGLVVLAIAALVAAVIFAWQNFAWFREAVTAAWTGIVAAASWAWNSVLMPIFSLIGTVLTAVGGFFVGLWTMAVAAWNGIVAAVSAAWTGFIWPVLQAIGTALAYLGLAIFAVLVTPFYLAWQAVSAVAQWAWNAILSPIFTAIWGALQWLGTQFMALWNAYVVPAWHGVVAAVQIAWAIIQFVWNYIRMQLIILGMQFMALWNTYVVPAWNGIVAAIRAAWAFVLGIFTAIWNYISAVLGPIFMFLWQSVIVPVWNGIVAAIRGAWDFIQGIFNTGKSAVDAVGRAFQSVADWIARAWNSIREATRGPIQFVVDVVYNNGLRNVWNGIAGLFGMAQLNPVRFAEGGVLPGYTPGRDPHVFTSPTGGSLALSGGEGILVPEAVRGLGGAGFVGWANRTFSGGRSSGGAGTPQGGFAAGGMLGAGPPVRFAEGGILGGVGDFLSGGAAFFGKVFTDPVGAVTELFSGVVGDGARTPGAGGWTDALKKVPGKAVEGVIKKVKEWVASLAAMGGSGGNWGPVAAQALAITGQSQSLLWRVLKQIQIESGGNPRAINLWDSNARKGTPSKGLIQTIDPTFQAYRMPGLPNDPYHPLSNIVAGIRYAISRYGSIAAIWPKTMGYDRGGEAAGTGYMLKQTIAPERVLSPRQTQDFARLTAALDRGELGALSRTVTTVRTVLGDLRGQLAALKNAAAAQSAMQTAPPVTRTVVSPLAQAAREALAAVRRGERLHEDFSYHGMSRLGDQFNEQLSDLFHVKGRDYTGSAQDTADMARFLERTIAAGTTTTTLAPGADRLVQPAAPAPAMNRARIDAMPTASSDGPRTVINVNAAPGHDTDRIASDVMRKLEFAERNR